MRRRVLWSVIGVLVVGAACMVGVRASDHDDGETDVKARSLNLTDLYVFREGDQTGNAPDNANLIFIMNTNPRSVATQQYYFSTQARYEFHVTRRTGPNDPVTATDDVLLRIEFGAPDATNRQAMTVTAILDGQTHTATVRSDNGMDIETTPITQAAAANPFDVNGNTLTVFAGLREDPFFFDVEQYFRVRNELITTGVTGGFRAPANAIDFTAGYNVNTVVLRVPIAFLAGTTGATTFDVWETISIPQ